MYIIHKYYPICRIYIHLRMVLFLRIKLYTQKPMNTQTYSYLILISMLFVFDVWGILMIHSH